MAGAYEITGEQQPGGFILPQELEIIERLPESPFVIDVGANIGDFTQAVIERRPGAVVLAFEPQPEAVAHFRRRFEGNARVAIRQMAVSTVNGRRELFSSDPISQLATFFPRSHLPEIKLFPAGEVPTITIAQALSDSGHDRIDLLKIDAEGSELDVLRGAVPVLPKTDLILWELILGDTRYTDDQPEDFRNLLELGLGFNVESLSPETGNGMALFAATRCGGRGNQR